MIKLELDNKTIEVPDELTVKKYQMIRKNEIKYSNPLEVLALYLDCETEELADLPKDSVVFVESYITNQIISKENIKLLETFQHNGIEYGLENDWGNMTYGQWVDMEVFSAEDKVQDSIHILLAILYRPIVSKTKKGYVIEKYNSKTTLERAEQFLDLPISVWFGSANFFLLISLEFINRINSSLSIKTKIIKMMKPITKILPTRLHPKILQDFTLDLPTSWPKKILRSLKK